MSYSTINGYRQTVRWDLREVYWVRDSDQWYPKIIEDAGIGFNNLTNYRVEDLDINSISTETGAGDGDTFEAVDCHNLTVNNCDLSGWRGNGLTLTGLTGTTTFNDCTIGPSSTAVKIEDGHSHAAVITNCTHVVFNNCTFSAEEKIPEIVNSIVTLNDCSISFGLEGIEIVGALALVNITGTTTFTNIADWDGTVNYPANLPISVYESGTGLNDFTRPCIHFEQFWDWTNDADAPNEEEMIVVQSGTQADLTALLSATPFAPVNMPAAVIDLYVETWIGTPNQWNKWLKATGGGGALDMNLTINNMLVLDKAVDARTIARALETKPVRKR